MEPWLDSLSEDWKSEHHSSLLPPNENQHPSREGTKSSTKSQTRIPHLGRSQTEPSTKQRFLQSRSLRNSTRTKDAPVLAERTSSNLNKSAQPLASGDSISQATHRASTLPRRSSSVFSDSVQSVQHHTLNPSQSSRKERNLPEWKKRLAQGEDAAADGCDLFSPSRLEGIFKHPPTRQDENKGPASANGCVNFWSTRDSAVSSTYEQYQSMRASRMRPLELDIVEEVNEDENTNRGSSVIDQGMTNNASLRGLVKSRVTSFEQTNEATRDDRRAASGNRGLLQSVEKDPRRRTASGQEEIRNEWISPITLSKQNSIRGQILTSSRSESVAMLHAKLEKLSVHDSRRPSSSSSDKDISYAQPANSHGFDSNGHLLSDLTSQSLPEDLSMGTQEFIVRGGYVNKHRGGFLNEDSLQRDRMSLLPVKADVSQSSGLQFCSSPPMQTEIQSSSIVPDDPGLVSTPSSPSGQKSSGSPLKLFGNRDTYTNNKLLRALSRFEDSTGKDGQNGDGGEQPSDRRERTELRMSQFGQGDLDQYDFVNDMNIEPPLDLEVGSKFEEHNEPKQQPVSRDVLYSQNLSPDETGNHSSNMRTKHGKTGERSGDGNSLPSEAKRSIQSPLKDRTPKRRRTVLRQEIQVQFSPQWQSQKATEPRSNIIMAGRKRKDARYDGDGQVADPETLAARQILHPRMSRRPSSDRNFERGLGTLTMDLEAHATENKIIPDTTEAVATELAQVVSEARKTSVTTQDYMEEATKIMQLIRAKGKPKSGLSSVEEPVEQSELNPDGNIDPEEDEMSSGDDFSRPPSRDNRRDYREQRNPVHHDPRILSQLRKFKESDDLETLIESSILEPAPSADNAEAQTAALVPIPEDEEQNYPPNIRIRDSLEVQRKRKHSTSTMGSCHLALESTIPSTQNSSASSTQRTIPTGSSGSSGRKGLINPGTVPIPDQVGKMTFNHATKTWEKDTSGTRQASPERKERQATSDEDPFEHIPDLSIDEGQEVQRRIPVRRAQQQTSESDDLAKGKSSVDRHCQPLYQPEEVQPPVLRSQAAEHEIRVHDGQLSEAPSSVAQTGRQARVVTVAFSSPLISAVAGHHQDDVSSLPLDVDHNYVRTPDPGQCQTVRVPADGNETAGTAKIRDTGKAPKPRPARQRANDGQAFSRRPISRIEERDENEVVGDLSLVPINKDKALTPLSRRNKLALSVPQTGLKASSLICLTPLSDFSVHQSDRPQQHETSYVAQRTHPSSLRQAHGSLALVIDDLVEAITDAEPSELFWDHLRHLNLSKKKLTTLHGLEEYCATLETLTISDNQIRQLTGVPESVRILQAQQNSLSSLTSWGHLCNLQYLYLSGNELEDLEGLRGLYHLRELNVDDNRILDIDGVLDLNGLQTLSLRGNHLASVDFEGTELTRLKRLDISRNQLAFIRNLQWLPALEDLMLEDNDLSEFMTSGEAAYTSIRKLHISGNRLQRIDLGLAPNLVELYADRNSLQEIGHLDRARHLSSLSLREQIDSPDIIKEVLSTPNDCRKMYLSCNAQPEGKLRSPSQTLFSLQYLELASCGISTLDPNFGARIPNCRVLNLNFNAITRLGPLQGISQLNKLLLAGNRLDRLRRTCIGLSRHPALTKLDLRNNPLTIGFHSPNSVDGRLAAKYGSKPEMVEIRDPYTLLGVPSEDDVKWLGLMDEGTRLRRQTIELMLSQSCTGLIELDGLPFDTKQTFAADELWEMLTTLGVLKRPLLTTAALEQLPEGKSLQQSLIRDARRQRTGQT